MMFMTLSLKSGGYETITFIDPAALESTLPIIQRGGVSGWSVFGTAAEILIGLGCRRALK